MLLASQVCYQVRTEFFLFRPYLYVKRDKTGELLGTTQSIAPTKQSTWFLANLGTSGMASARKSGPVSMWASDTRPSTYDYFKACEAVNPWFASDKRTQGDLVVSTKIGVDSSVSAAWAISHNILDLIASDCLSLEDATTFLLGLANMNSQGVITLDMNLTCLEYSHKKAGRLTATPITGIQLNLARTSLFTTVTVTANGTETARAIGGGETVGEVLSACLEELGVMGARRPSAEGDEIGRCGLVLDVPEATPWFAPFFPSGRPSPVHFGAPILLSYSPGQPMVVQTKVWIDSHWYALDLMFVGQNQPKVSKKVVQCKCAKAHGLASHPTTGVYRITVRWTTDAAQAADSENEELELDDEPVITARWTPSAYQDSCWAKSLLNLRGALLGAKWAGPRATFSPELIEITGGNVTPEMLGRPSFGGIYDYHNVHDISSGSGFASSYIPTDKEWGLSNGSTSLDTSTGVAVRKLSPGTIGTTHVTCGVTTTSVCLRPITSELALGARSVTSSAGVGLPIRSYPTRQSRHVSSRHEKPPVPPVSQSTLDRLLRAANLCSPVN